MKKKHTAQSGLFGLRPLLALFFCTVGVCSMITGTLLAFFHPEAPAKASHPAGAGLTFAARVAYQRAIEEVYWRHRIWPKETAKAKPPLDAVMSQAQMEEKVADYLRKSQALEEYWQRSITAEQLQSEMDRMAQGSKQPEVLQELFQALGNDSFLIAECLARATLAERLFTSALAYQDVSWAMSQPINSGKADKASFSGYTLPKVPTTLNGEGACIDAWAATSTVNAPTARDLHTAVWTGSEMIVWGGTNFGNYLNTGGRYNPSTDSWTATSTTSAPSARARHTAVWTGSEMIVWGGSGDSTGAKYNPMTDIWTTTSTSNAPSGRSGHTAVWTGSEMIVWGGGNYLSTGGKYNPSMDTWAATSTTNAPTGRVGHTAVWTGSEMIVWGGGASGPVYFNTGGRYNPSTDSWTATNTTNAPTGRGSHTAVWADNEMIVWGGGISGPTNFNTGGRYNPGTDSWTATSTSNAPSARVGHAAVWTGSQMVMWGGITIGGYLNTGGRYNPTADTWMATSTSNAPSGRYDHRAVWTSSEMIVWGGIDDSGLANTGGRYCGQYPTPTPTPTASPTPTPTATPTVITVTNTNDSGPGSLRQALVDANDFDTIDFAVTGTIGLTSGELLVNKVLTISGPGPENLAINGNAKNRVFHVSHFPGNITISGLTITNGHAGGNFPDDSGGGIYNDHARLTIVNCAIDGNYAARFGSGIYNDGHAGGIASLVIDHSSVVGNSGNNAIYNDADLIGSAGTLITNSMVSDNVGDAIHSAACGSPHGGSPEVQVISSTISGNSGGIFNDCLSHALISNSTSSGNAGGIYNIWHAEITHSTFSNVGSNVYNDTFFGLPASMSIGSTVLKAGPSEPNIVNHGTITSYGYSVSSDNGGGYLNGPGDQINTNPMLGPLQDNGGPTFTHALLPDSPAINAGDPNFVSPPDYDQRGPGYDRVRGGRIDVGSFEVQNPPAPSPTPRTTPTPRLRPTPPPRP